MNQVFIIGNGFDLAHGLKTSYQDLMLHFAKKNVKQKINNPYLVFSDRHYPQFEEGSQFPPKTDSVNSVKELLGILNKEGWDSYTEKRYWDILINEFNIGKWVDIERFYFDNLCADYQKGIGIKRFNEVDSLNEFMDEIKTELFNYLNTLLLTEIGPIPHLAENILSQQDKFSSRLFLNFNYTSTIENYIVISEKCKLINIHGNLSDPLNKVIFGYGDEKDSYYQKFEDLNDNRFLSHSKSVGYSQTDNYKELDNFISKEEYKVIILGHSCGISDKILLNNIFENANCRKIRIYYYQFKGGDDYDEKFMEISRHFFLMENIGCEPWLYQKISQCHWSPLNKPCTSIF